MFRPNVDTDVDVDEKGLSLVVTQSRNLEVIKGGAQECL
jgi:hypothetical protein